MLDKIGQKQHKIMDLSWDIQKVRINYKDLILAWLFWIDTDPEKLVEMLDAYRKLEK